MFYNKIQPIVKPHDFLQELPASRRALELIEQSRLAARNIIQGLDNRLLIIVGPCSIHDPEAAMEYAALLNKAAKDYADDLFIIMRVYFEKPRTTYGWKGLINDPYLNGSFDINHGLRLARKLLLNLTDIELPAATEFLDTMIPHYLSDLISWSAIGARTSASQVHRELASGLSLPVGFKNSPDGNIQIAIDAVKVASQPHHFLSITTCGTPTIVSTAGNKICHIILRGSEQGANFEKQHVAHASKLLQDSQLTPRLMIDCSHGNSMKDYQRQINVVNSIAEQIKLGSQKINGIMLESNLIAGKQTLHPHNPLIYGKSITDACLAWNETVPLLEQLANAVRVRNKLKIVEQEWL